MPREPKVTLTLSEADARWLLRHIEQLQWPYGQNAEQLRAEINHALAECECARRVAAEETR